MHTLSPLKKDWVITQEAFDLLLAFFDADRELAAAKYEDLRRRLVRYLKYWGSPCPEDHAAKAIDRSARRLAEGTQLDRNNYVGFFCRVAHNILHEYWKRVENEPVSVHDLPRAIQPAYDPQEVQQREHQRVQLERMLECQQICLRALSAEERDLIRIYHDEVDGKKIENRKALAARLGITLNALRSKTCRVRSRLEDCVDLCLAKRDE